MCAFVRTFSRGSTSDKNAFESQANKHEQGVLGVLRLYSYVFDLSRP